MVKKKRQYNNSCKFSFLPTKASTLRTAKLLQDMSSTTVARPTDKLPLPLRPTDDDWSKLLAAHVHMGTKNLDNKMVKP